MWYIYCGILRCCHISSSHIELWYIKVCDCVATISDHVGHAVAGDAACPQSPGARGPHAGHTPDGSHQAPARGPERTLLEKAARKVKDIVNEREKTSQYTCMKWLDI